MYVISLQGEAKAYQTFFAFIGVSLIPLSILTKNFILSLGIITMMTIPTYDYDQSH